MITDDKKKVLALFQKGRNLYTLMKFSEAQSCFKEALKIDPLDGPSQVYLDRCEHYIQNPPPEDWDGVFVMKTK